jgi:hypothetical protein
MLQPVFDFIEKFATDFSWKRLIIFFSIILILGFIYFIYESQTANSQLTKYERTIDLVKKFDSINTENSQTKKSYLTFNLA